MTKLSDANIVSSESTNVHDVYISSVSLCLVMHAKGMKAVWLHEIPSLLCTTEVKKSSFEVHVYTGRVKQYKQSAGCLELPNSAPAPGERD